MNINESHWISLNHIESHISQQTPTKHNQEIALTTAKLRSSAHNFLMYREKLIKSLIGGLNSCHSIPTTSLSIFHFYFFILFIISTQLLASRLLLDIVWLKVTFTNRTVWLSLTVPLTVKQSMCVKYFIVLYHHILSLKIIIIM